MIQMVHILGLDLGPLTLTIMAKIVEAAVELQVDKDVQVLVEDLAPGLSVPCARIPLGFLLLRHDKI